MNDLGRGVVKLYGMNHEVELLQLLIQECPMLEDDKTIGDKLLLQINNRLKRANTTSELDLKDARSIMAKLLCLDFDIYRSRYYNEKTLTKEVYELAGNLCRIHELLKKGAVPKSDYMKYFSCDLCVKGVATGAVADLSGLDKVLESKTKIKSPPALNI